MSEWNQMTRRLFLAAGLEGMRQLLAAASTPAPQSSPGARAYRIDATIVFLSVPLFTRSNVGSGFARHLLTEGSGARTHVLEFAAGSVPERCEGLNRLGLLRERVVESGRILGADYFGFMTESKEESLHQARKALGKAPAKSVFVAIQGHTSPEEVRCRRAQFTAQTRPDTLQWKWLQSLAEAAFNQPGRNVERHSPPPAQGAAPATFLFAVLRATRTGGKLTQEYVYGGDRFELRTTNRPDPVTGRRLHAKGITPDPEKVNLLTAEARNTRTGKRSSFRMWSEDSGTAPLRIEYQPRGFLVLALEATSARTPGWPL